MPQYSADGKKQFHPTIEITDGYKHYGFRNHWRLILRGFNLKVYSGEIYVLLGPHGCGKSTALNVILGLVKLTQGNVQVFGFKPGHKMSGIPGIRVGFTPQNSGLYRKFTVNEILRYYGALLGLTHRYIDERISFLTDLLDLPTDKIQVQYYTRNLKGQISFAIALLHEPELLILDEPTCGVDPVLRKSIWQHLRDLAKKNEKTILVTTVNCLDALEADRMGIMKNGYLLVENNPKVVLSKQKTDKIENLYMKIYSQNLKIELEQKQSLPDNPLIKLEQMDVAPSEGFMYTETAPDSVVLAVEKPKNSLAQIASNTFKYISSCLPSCHRVCAVICRDLLRCLRSYISMILFLICPALFMVIFGYTIGTNPYSIVLGVVNYEVLPAKCASRYSEFASCQILDLIDKKSIVQKDYDNEKDARQAVLDLESFGVLVVGKNFTKRVEEDVKRRQVKSKAELTSSIVLYLDEAVKIIADSIRFHLLRAFTQYIESVQQIIDKKLSPYPIETGPPIYGNSDIDAIHYLAPGYAITAAYHLAAWISAFYIVKDKVDNLFQRDYLAGAKLTEIVLAQLITYGTIISIQTVLVFVIMIVVIGVPMEGPLFYLILVVLLQIWTGLSFGVFLSTMFTSGMQACCGVLCFWIASMLLEGVLWPLESVPDVMRMIVNILPQTKSVKTIRCLMLRGTNMQTMGEWMGVIIPICWMVIFIILFNILNRYENKAK